jgi:hypothetical protein
MEDTPPDSGRKRNAQQHRTNDFRANLAATARDWEHRFPEHGGSNRVSREAGQETLHLVESMASFSLRFGCAGCNQFRHPLQSYSATLCKVIPPPDTTLFRQ